MMLASAAPPQHDARWRRPTREVSVLRVIRGVLLTINSCYPFPWQALF